MLNFKEKIIRIIIRIIKKEKFIKNQNHYKWSMLLFKN